LSFVHGELCDSFEILASKWRRCPKNEHIGPSNSAQRSVSEPSHPWHKRTVVKAYDEFDVHCDPPSDAFHETDEIRRDATLGHEVDERDRPILSIEGRLQDESIVEVTARYAGWLGARRDQPAPIIGASEQRREARATVKPRPAQPVDRAVSANKSGRSTIADDRVVLDPHG
jgi:hypothetical protein